MIQVTLGSAYHNGACTACDGGQAQVVTCIRFRDEIGLRDEIVRLCDGCRADLMLKLGKLVKPTRRKRG